MSGNTKESQNTTLPALDALKRSEFLKTKYLNNGNIESLSNATIEQKQIRNDQGHSNSVRIWRAKDAYNVSGKSLFCRTKQIPWIAD